MSFFAELKRRNVIRVGVAYVLLAWVVLQISDFGLDLIDAPNWVIQSLTLFAGIGLPIALIIAWVFEMTPEGLRREKDIDRSESITSETGKKLNLVITTLLVLALAYIALDKFKPDENEASPQEPAIAQAGDDTGTITAPAASDEFPSIAVMPFLNMSEDSDNEYFSDGISEEILNLLAQIPELTVTSRSSAFSFKGKNASIPEIADTLGVEHVLEGSVRKAGSQVRITAQLIRASNDAHLWSETFDRKLDDIFAVQDEISEKVVAALQIELLGSAPQAIATNSEAYALYLHGRELLSGFEEATIRAGKSAMEKALDIDPDYAPAWAGLGRAHWELGDQGHEDIEESLVNAKAAVSRALELDPTLAEAWVELALLQFGWEWSWDQAEGSIRTAALHGPGLATVWRTRSRIARALGRNDEALEYARRGMELDPINIDSRNTLILAYWSLSDFAEVERLGRESVELYAEGEGAGWVGYALIYQNAPEAAFAWLAKQRNPFWREMGEIMALYDSGRVQESDLLLQKMIAEDGHYGAIQIAIIFSRRGDRDKAFEWLDRSIAQRDGGISGLIADPEFKSLHGDPRWEATLNRVGLLPYWQALPAREDSLLP